MVSASNNATGLSEGAPFTLTADDTPPTVGALTYLDGPSASTSVSLTFTTDPEDSGSGVGTRLLQRASASIVGSTCGPFGTFTTVANGTNPTTSPLSDTLVAGNCYKYQYVISDNVGNQLTIVSASTVRVAAT